MIGELVVNIRFNINAKGPAIKPTLLLTNPLNSTTKLQ